MIRHHLCKGGSTNAGMDWNGMDYWNGQKKSNSLGQLDMYFQPGFEGPIDTQRHSKPVKQKAKFIAFKMFCCWSDHFFGPLIYIVPPPPPPPPTTMSAYDITITEIGWQEWEGLCEAAENGYFWCMAMLTTLFQGICVYALSTPGPILTEDPSIDSNTI